MAVTSFNPDKMYTYLRGFASGAGMKETLKALSFAREKHTGQRRKSGEPYIVHPLMMACNAVSIGIRDDTVIATILLHDVCEDCGVSLAELPVSDRVKRAVDLMTFRVMEGETKEIAKNRYYNLLLGCREAALTKLIDRCHNVIQHGRHLLRGEAEVLHRGNPALCPATAAQGKDGVPGGCGHPVRAEIPHGQRGGLHRCHHSGV